MNEILLHGDEDIEICLSLTSMRINVRNANKQSLLSNKLSGQKEWVLHMLSAQYPKINSSQYESIPIRNYKYYESVSYEKRSLSRATSIFMKAIGYAKNAGKRT